MKFAKTLSLFKMVAVSFVLEPHPMQSKSVNYATLATLAK